MSQRQILRAREPEDTPRRHAATPPEHNSTARTLALQGTTLHTPTQLRLASPARSHARTHERNEYDFPVGLTIPTSDEYMYIYITYIVRTSVVLPLAMAGTYFACKMSSFEN